MAGVVAGSPVVAEAAVPPGFTVNQVVSNLDTPTAVEVAPNGAIFVIEKRGRVLRYDSAADPTATLVADRRVPTHNNSDRGMIGLAVNPDYPVVPWVYVSYSLDQDPAGGPIPAYGVPGGNYDACPNDDTIGCPAKSRVVRFDGTIANAPEQVLFEGHCQQFPYHSVGDLVFENANSLLVSFGDGSTGSFVEYGQRGNLCADPPGAAGTNLSAPSTEGGQGRAQDILTRNDPLGVHGSVLRVDPNTFDPLPQNPMFGDAETNAARMIGTGLRNPFRLGIDSANGRIYVGNVGGAGFDEINLIEGPGLFNGGWPCYEGSGTTKNTFWLTTTMCQNLIASGDHDAPAFFYGRNEPIVAGEPCADGGLSISGVAVNRSGFGPASMDGALFFTDYTRDCIWYLPQGNNGRPNAAAPELFADGLGAIVDLNFGPDGALYAVDIVGGRVLQVVENGGNQAPTASFVASPTQGAAPLVVNVDAAASSDPNAGDTLSYAWDFDADGTTDATGVTASHTFQINGAQSVLLTVTDQDGLANVTSRTVQVGIAQFTVDVTEPAVDRTFKVGAGVPVRATATYADGSPVPVAAFSWELNIDHCVPNAPAACHQHGLTGIQAARSYFTMPDHEYPSSVQVILTVDPADAAPQTFVMPVNYRVVDLDVEAQPNGLVVNVGSAEEASPFTRLVGMGATTNASVASTQTLNGVTYAFDRWVLDGADLSTQPAVELSGSTNQTLRAVFIEDGGGVDTLRPSTPRGLGAGDGPNGPELTWTGSNDNVGVVGYQVLRSTDGTLGDVYATSSGVGTAYVDTNAQVGVTYTYAIKAIDAAGNISFRTNLATVTPSNGGSPDSEPPTTPKGLRSDNNAAGVELAWVGSTDNVAVVGYQVFRSTDGTLGAWYATSSGLGTSYVDTNVQAGVTYTYAVKAIDAAGNTSSRTNLSEELYPGAGGGPDLTPPSTPRGLRTNPGVGGVVLTWTASNDDVGVVGYQIFRSTDGTLGSLYGTSTGVGTMYIDTNVQVGVTYTYAIKAIDAAGNTSSRSNLSEEQHL